MQLITKDFHMALSHGTTIKQETRRNEQVCKQQGQMLSQFTSQLFSH